MRFDFVLQPGKRLHGNVMDKAFVQQPARGRAEQRQAFGQVMRNCHEHRARGRLAEFPDHLHAYGSVKRGLDVMEMKLVLLRIDMELGNPVSAKAAARACGLNNAARRRVYQKAVIAIVGQKFRPPGYIRRCQKDVMERSVYRQFADMGHGEKQWQRDA